MQHFPEYCLIVALQFVCDSMPWIIGASSWSKGSHCSQDLEADLVLWTTGSQPSSKAKAGMELPFPCNDKGAMKTYDTLQIVGNPHVFALGDLASSAVDGQQLGVLPATAQASFLQEDH